MLPEMIGALFGLVLYWSLLLLRKNSMWIVNSNSNRTPHSKTYNPETHHWMFRWSISMWSVSLVNGGTLGASSWGFVSKIHHAYYSNHPFFAWSVCPLLTWFNGFFMFDMLRLKKIKFSLNAWWGVFGVRFSESNSRRRNSKGFNGRPC